MSSVFRVWVLTLLFLSWASSATAAPGCPDVQEVAQHLAPIPQTARPGDILDYIREIPRLEDRALFRELITAARTQNPPLRGIEIYERVVLQSVLNNGRRRAILDTRIPTRGPMSENVVSDMIRHIEQNPACGPRSICGSEGEAEFFLYLARRGTSQSLVDAVRTHIQSRRARAVALQKQLLQRLLRARDAGEIRYEDLVRLSAQYMAVNDFSFDVAVLREFQSPHVELQLIIDLLSNNLESSIGMSRVVNGRLADNLLMSEAINRMVIVPSVRSYSQIEIGPPGHMISPIELAPRPLIADLSLRTPYGNGKHDRGHRAIMLRGAPQRLDDLPAQVERLHRWDAVDRFRAELRVSDLDLQQWVDRRTYSQWHEAGREAGLLWLYFKAIGSVEDRRVPAVSWLEGNPRWMSEIEWDLNRRIDQVLAKVRARQNGRRMAAEIIRRESLTDDSSIRDLGRLIGVAIDARGVVSVSGVQTPHSQRLIDLFFDRLGIPR